MNVIITIIILALMLTAIISIHEFGHFIAAKKSGVYIDEFSIGMGPVIFKHKPKKSETTFSIRALPIGGFVSMAEKLDPDNKKIKKERVLENKSFLKQFWVFIDGIVFNFILALVLFLFSGLLYGRPVNSPVIAEVPEDGAAYKVGFEKGDRILYINGKKIDSRDDFILEAVAKKAGNIYTFVMKKSDGREVTYLITPDKDEEGNNVYGIMFEGTKFEKGFGNALKYSVEGTIDTTATILKILGSLFSGKISVNNLSGPVGIYSIVDSVKSQGLINILYLTAYLSINIAIINLLPIPVFDGGRVFILIIEKIIGRKTNEKLENILNLVGFGLMILLMIYVTFNDIVRLVK